LKLIYLPNFILFYFIIFLRTAHKIHDYRREKKMSQGRSVRPGETWKMGSSEPRQMKNIYNKKKWWGMAGR